MTIIVWDGQTLAADKLIVSSGAVRARGTKIYKSNNNRMAACLVGYSGPLSLAQEFFCWADLGFSLEQMPSKHADPDKGGIGMVIKPDKTIWIYDHSATPYRIEYGNHAIGAAAEAGRACLLFGHKAVEIVKNISAVSVVCGEGVDSISFTTETTEV